MVQVLSGGVNFYGISIFFVAIIKEFGWSRTLLSSVFSLSRLEGGVMGPLEGILTDKLGPRKLMVVGLPLMALGFVLLSQVNSLLAMLLVYILPITLGSTLGTFTPVSAAIANWFVRRRAIALGCALSGTALGGAAVVPVLGWWISTYGWRSATVAAGALILVLGFPIALIMRHRPEQYGYLPDGVDPTIGPCTSATETRQAEGAPQAPEAVEFRPLQSLKTPAFWLIGLSLSLRSIVTTGFTLHFAAMMVDRGLSLAVASSFLGSVALISLVGRLGLGWLGDTMDKRYLLAATMSVMGLAMLGMSQAQGMGLVVVLLVVYAVTYGGAVTLPMALQADYFGRRAFATIWGLLHVVQTAGMMIGPVFAGFVYDITQSYFLAFVGFGAAALLAAILLACVRRPAAPPSIPASAYQV